MSGAEHLRARTPSDVLLEDQIPGIHVRLRTDPDVIADDRRAIEAALDVGLCPDEHAVAELERFEVLEPDAAADLETVAAAASGGAPDAAAHHDVDRAVADREACVQLD